MNLFTETVIDIIKSIPKGKVMTYGQIARIAGSPKSARQVVRIIHSMSDKYNLPWHRIINSKGEIGIPDANGANMQRTLLISEGVEFIDQRKIDLEKYQY